MPVPAANWSHDEPSAYLAAGVGIPELAFGEIGDFVVPRLAVEAHFGWVLFNPMVGLGVDGAVWSSSRGTLGHSITLCAEAMVNPTLGELRLTSGGETLGAFAGVYGGYRWMADSGFLLRVAAGPNFTAGVGWAL
jgi:hypothetical protein